MPETLKMLVAVPGPLLEALDKEAATLELTKNQLLLKIAHEYFELPFEARGRGALAQPKEPEPVYKCKTDEEAVAKAIEVGAAITAKIGKKTYRVFRSGLMKPVGMNIYNIHKGEPNEAS